MSDKSYNKEFSLSWTNNNELLFIMDIGDGKSEEIAFPEETAYEIYKFLKDKFRDIVKTSQVLD